MFGTSTHEVAEGKVRRGAMEHYGVLNTVLDGAG